MVDKENEEARAKQFKIYQQTVYKMPVHIYWKDTNYCYTDCNLLQAQDLGFKSENDLIGKSDYDIHSELDAKRIRKNDAQVIQSGLSAVFEEEIFIPGKGRSVYLTQKTPIMTDAGEVIGLAGISFDITLRKIELENANQDKENIELTLSNILDNLPGHVYWKNMEGVFQGCNSAQASAAGFYNKQDMIGKTDFDMPWYAQANQLRESDQLVMKTKQTLTREELSQLEGSDHVSVFLSKKSPMFNKQGDVIGILGISFDITDRKKLESDLIIAKEKAEAANEAKSDFMSNMEHDLRTPFSGIGGVADLLYTMYSEKYPELKELFELMTKSCAQWQEIHNRIFDALDLQQQLKVDRFYVQDEIEKIKELMGATAKMKKLDFRVSYPSRDETGPIETDLLKFKLILSSLVGNALNFTEKGSVTIKLFYEPGVFIIRVIDTGVGIPKDKFKAIFEKFTKLSRSNTYGDHFKGMGLGLYNAERDAEKIQATITVESEVGVGSTFEFRLPAKLERT